MLSYTSTPIQEIKSSLLEKAGVNVFVKREDLNHPFVSGNKWWKLKRNLEQAKEEGVSTLLTFGGAYSNHIYATAAAAQELGFKCIGIIRGEEITALSKTLQFATEQGMQLHFISREAYRQKAQDEFVARLKDQFGDFYLIPEGGTNSLAVQGVEEFAQQLNKEMDADFVWRVIGFSSLKGDFLSEEVRRLLDEEIEGEEVSKLERYQKSNWHIEDGYHFGGYAKHTPELLMFIKNFEKEFSIPVEHVYTGKLFFGLFDLIQRGHFPKGSKIMALHTGGLQGKLEQL